MKLKTAKYLNDLFLDYSSSLSDSIGVVKENCNEVELKAYTKPASQILALTFDILDDIHEQYPELKPEKFD